MTKHSFQGSVPEIAKQLSLILLLSSMEKELFQGTKNCREIGHLDKEAGHMHTYLRIQNLLNNPFLTTHTPHGGKHPTTRKTLIEYAPATRTEECA